jgi:hypothetical protein
MEELSEPERIALVEEAASNAQLLETVQAMPNGINTKIGDRSEENLSDGQTQRLSLARGFLKDAEVIMMDEPTSGENLNVFFVRPLFTLRMMILPGQARDKDRESSTQRTDTGFLLQRWTLLLRGVLSTV